MSENSVLAVSVEDLAGDLEDASWASDLSDRYLKELCLEYLENGDSALFKRSLEKLAMALDIL